VQVYAKRVRVCFQKGILKKQALNERGVNRRLVHCKIKPEFKPILRTSYSRRRTFRPRLLYCSDVISADFCKSHWNSASIRQTKLALSFA
jgi:hypothetical protein